VPITQERMSELIDAATDFEQALGKLVITIQRTSEAYFAGQLSESDALSQIATMADPAGLLQDYKTSSLVLAMEVRHRKLTHRRNAREAERQRLQRAGATKATAPFSLVMQRDQPSHQRVAEAERFASRGYQRIARLSGTGQPTQQDLERGAAQAAATVTPQIAAEVQAELERMKQQPATQTMHISPAQRQRNHEINKRIAEGLGMELREDDPATDPELTLPDEPPE
jgi:hypothetical protein